MSASSSSTNALYSQGARARPAPPPLRLQSNRSLGGSSAGATSPRDHQSAQSSAAASASSPSGVVRGRSPALQNYGTRLQHQQPYAPSRSGSGQTTPTLNIRTTRSASQGRSLDLLDSGRRSASPGGGGQDVEVSARSMSPPLFSPGRRSITPSQSQQHNALMSPIRSDLEVFAQHCKAWFFVQDATAGKAMQETLANLPPFQKPTYLKLQAIIRSAFHSASSLRRLQEYRAHLSSVQPGHSLGPGLRLTPRSSDSRKHRLERFTRFVKMYCSQTAPGTLPFFEGLHAVLRLQLLPANLGGAGQQRIEWEVDDAVFMESGPKEFTQDAVDVLKGVLGFEESLNSGNPEDSVLETTALDGGETDSETELDLPSTNVSANTSMISNTARTQPSPPALPLRVRRLNPASPASESVPSVMPGARPQAPSQNIPYAAQSTHSFLNRVQNRHRATSDPFSDPGGRSSPSLLGINGSTSYVSRAGMPSALSGIGERDDDEPPADGSGEGLVASHSRHQSHPLPSSSSAAAADSYTTLARGQQSLDSPSYFPRSGRSTPMEDYPPLPLQRMPTSASRVTLSLDNFDVDDLVYGRSAAGGPYGTATRPPTQAELDLLQTPQMRVWIVPSYIANPELQGLLAVFPQSIANRPLPRFSAVGGKPSKKRKKKEPDLEEGGDEEVHDNVAGHWRGEVKRGAGRIWVGERLRDDNWRGGMWARLVMWFKSMFS